MNTSGRHAIGLAVAVGLAVLWSGTWAAAVTRDLDNGSHSPRAVRFVRPGGIDSGDCSDPANPCATLSYAVSQALGGDVVRLAVGSHPSGSTSSWSLAVPDHPGDRKRSPR